MDLTKQSPADAIQELLRIAWIRVADALLYAPSR
jgi:hypothetical protein